MNLDLEKKEIIAQASDLIDMLDFVLKNSPVEGEDGVVHPKNSEKYPISGIKITIRQIKGLIDSYIGQSDSPIDEAEHFTRKEANEELIDIETSELISQSNVSFKNISATPKGEESVQSEQTEYYQRLNGTDNSRKVISSNSAVVMDIIEGYKPDF